MALKLNSSSGGSVTLQEPTTASNYTLTVPAQTSTLATTVDAGNYYAFKNRIINGNMAIDQRNAGAAAPITNAQAQNWGVDRFNTKFFGSGYPSGTFANAQQSTDAPTGFSHSLRITASQAVGFPANGSQLGGWIEQGIEANNIADFLSGSGTTAFFIGFWVKASKTGVVSVSVECYDVGGSYCTTVNIAQANTWEYKSVAIPAQNSYRFNVGNGTGFNFKIGLGGNTSWLVSTNNQWNSNASARGVLSANQTNFMSSVGDYLAITGVQLEKGTVATSFDYRPYGTELALCQRYCQVFRSLGGEYDYFAGAAFYNSTSGRAWKPLLTTMRASPTVSTSGTFYIDSVSYVSLNSVNLESAEPESIRLGYTASSAGSNATGYGAFLAGSPASTQVLTVSAEL